MKNTQSHPLIANLPPCCSTLLGRARRLPLDCLTHHPRWWFRLQIAWLLSRGLPAGESVQSVIGLPARLTEDEHRAYNEFFSVCRYLGLTEEQILLLLLVWLSTEPRVEPA